MKRIVVLLSSFNGEKYLKCQMDSILSQQLDDCELTLFVRDDGSKDSTIEILKTYEKQYNNVRVFYGKNEGLISSFFYLILKAKEVGFDYYALSDQDDKWDSDKLQIAINHLNEKDLPLLYESTVRITDEFLNLKKIDQIDVKPITFYNSIIQTISAGHTYVFNNRLMNEIRKDIDCTRIYVHDSFIHNIAVFKGKVLFDRTPHNDYRQHGNNVLGASQRKGIFNLIKMRIKRIKRGDNKKYAKQIFYYLDYFGDDLDPAIRDTIEEFFRCQRNFFTRLCYIFKTKLYRQTRFETLSFKLLYLFGGYNISNKGGSK